MNDLQITDALTVIAEIAVALAGFAGLIVTVRNRGLSSWAGNDLVRLRFMLSIACATFFASLTPYLLNYLITSSKAAWFLSGLILSLGLFFLLAVTIVQTWSIRHQLSKFWLALYELGTFFACVFVILGTFQLAGLNNSGTYLFGLLWMLFYSTSLFVRLILNPPGSEAGHADDA